MDQLPEDVTLVEALEQRAKREPSRPWAAVPKNNKDLSQGFRDISFAEFLNAVNHASHWLDDVLGTGQDRASTVAYMGFNDLHPAVLAMAAAKTGIKLLLPFPLAPTPAKKYLMKAAGCRALLLPSQLAEPISQLLENEPDMKQIVVPTFQDWFDNQAPSQYHSEYSQIKDKPWIIFHTSGTTGLPKLITYTQQMLAAQAHTDKNLVDIGRTTSMSLLNDCRVHCSIPLVHLVGLCLALPAPIIRGATLVLGPTDRPPSGATIADVLAYSGIQGLTTSPVWIHHLCNHSSSFERLRRLHHIAWAGTALDKFSGDALYRHTQLTPAMGTTECGPYRTYVCESPEDWAWYSFVPGQGITFDPATKEGQEGLYELVIRRDSAVPWQQIFSVFPELQEYRTKDLFRPHPDVNKKGLWLYTGRVDDMFKLSNGWPIQYTSREQIVEENPIVKTALIGAPGQDIAFLLVDVIDTCSDTVDTQARIWDTVQHLNAEHSKKTSIHKDMIILADPSRPFKRSAKDTILRKETFQLYEAEIAAHLEALGYKWNTMA